MGILKIQGNIENILELRKRDKRLNESLISNIIVVTVLLLWDVICYESFVI